MYIPTVSFVRNSWVLFFILIAAFFALAPRMVQAQADPGVECTGNSNETKYGLKCVGGSLAGELPFTDPNIEPGDQLPVLVGNIIKVILSLLGLIFLILIIYGGFKWMMAGGDSGAVEDARDIMVHAVIGLVIIVSAYTITNFVIDQVSKIDQAPTE